MLESRALPDLARWLHQHFERPPEEFEAGRRMIREALADHASLSVEEAGDLLDELERAGYVRYAAEARSIGGSTGTWIVYPSPQDNPDERAPGDRAIPT